MHAGITIAIDDRYEVWGSGIISIPWNFRMQDLKPQILKLLGPAVAQQSAPSSRTAQASLQSYSVIQVGPSFSVTGWATQASRYPRYRPSGLRQWANRARQKEAGQLDFCACGSIVSRHCKSCVSLNAFQKLYSHAKPARFLKQISPCRMPTVSVLL